MGDYVTLIKDSALTLDEQHQIFSGNAIRLLEMEGLNE